jgi:hypothetical protein
LKNALVIDVQIGIFHTEKNSRNESVVNDQQRVVHFDKKLIVGSTLGLLFGLLEC